MQTDTLILSSVMETLLPILQMRAQMLQDNNGGGGGDQPRHRFTSTASSVPSSPTTPLSPPISTGGGGGLPFTGSSAAAWGPADNQMYLNQLAVINLQLQQRRLLYSACNSSVSPPEPPPVSPPRSKFVGGTNWQSEPIDLSSGSSSGGEQKLAASNTLSSASSLSSTSPSSPASPPTRRDPPRIFTFETAAGGSAGDDTAVVPLGGGEPLCASTPAAVDSDSPPTTPPIGTGESGRKRSRSTSFEELKFEESEDDEVFEKAPLPEPDHPPHDVSTAAAAAGCDIKPAFRPYEETTTSKSSKAATKRRFTVPAPLPLATASAAGNSSLSSPLLNPHFSLSTSLHSATSLQSPFSPLLHHPALPFSPHFNFLTDPLSPFTPYLQQTPPVFRFPPAATAAGSEWCPPANLSPKFPAAPSSNLFTFPPTTFGGPENEARRQFLSRLHSTVLKLERRGGGGGGEEEDSAATATASNRNQLAGYQVKFERRHKVKGIIQGVPKRRPFLKTQSTPDLLSDEKEGKIIENIDFSYFSIGRLLWETLYAIFFNI